MKGSEEENAGQADQDRREVPAGFVAAETIVLNSRFVAEVDTVSTVGEARAFIAAARMRHPEANHHVPAYVLGGLGKGRSVVEYCSDDGEPGGTAGKPLLAVLRGSGFSDAIVVVSRYFGGTLLGTGGLVKAYSQAGRKALELCGTAVLVDVVSCELRLPYALYEPARQAAEALGGMELAAEFLEDVRLEIEIGADRAEALSRALADLSGGRISPVFGGRRVCRRPPPR